MEVDKSAQADDDPSANIESDEKVTDKNTPVGALRDSGAPFKPTNALGRSPPSKSSEVVNDLTTECDNGKPGAASSDMPARNRFNEAVNSCVVDAFSSMMSKKPNCSPNRKARERLNSLPSDMAEAVSGKRKNEMSPHKEPAKKGKTTVGGILGDLEGKIEVLAKQVNEQTTVKRETKLQMKFVTNCLAQLKREYEKEIMQNDWRNLPRADAEIAEFRDRIVAVENFSDINALISERWPNGCFKNTKVNHRRKCYEDDSALHSLLLYPQDLQQDKNFIALKEKIPAVRVITDDKLRELGFIPIRQEEATAIDGVEESSKRKTEVLIAAANLSDRNAPLDTADIINWADRIKLQAEAGGKSKISLIFPEDEHVDKIRKVFECRMAGTALSVQLVLNEKRVYPQRTQADNAIMIQGASYSDMLKSVKGGVTPEDVGIQIKKIQRTQAGALRLVVRETTTGAKEKFMQQMKAVLPSEANVSTFTPTKGIIIMDIEEDITIDELKEALASQLEVDVKQIRATKFRALHRGGKSTTVFLPNLAAEKAISFKRIKLGWSMCQIKEKFDPTLCANCQTFGHQTRTCTKKETTKKRCLKCGQEDHIAKDCINGERCFTCGENHSANSMRCSSYRALVGQMRARNNE